MCLGLLDCFGCTFEATIRSISRHGEKPTPPRLVCKQPGKVPTETASQRVSKWERAVRGPGEQEGTAAALALVLSGTVITVGVAYLAVQQSGIDLTAFQPGLLVRHILTFFIPSVLLLCFTLQSLLDRSQLRRASCSKTLDQAVHCFDPSSELPPPPSPGHRLRTGVIDFPSTTASSRQPAT